MNPVFNDQRRRCDQTAAWTLLHAYYQDHAQALDLREAFATDPNRHAQFTQQAPHLFADLSKNLIDATSQRLLLDLARECGLEQYRDAMFAGAGINQ